MTAEPNHMATVVEAGSPTQRAVSTTVTTLNVILNGARGGQGTSTIAAALALYATGHADTHLVAHDSAATAALLGLAAIADDGEARVTDRLTLIGPDAQVAGAPAVRIIDGPLDHPAPAERTVALTVLRGPCYVALRTIMVEPTTASDGIVVLAEAGRSLTSRDVAEVTGLPVVATVPVEPGVARTVDAGLLVSRLHRLNALAPLRRYLATLLGRDSSNEALSGLSERAAGSVVDLDDLRPPSVDKTGTDLPVALCATG